MSSYLFVYGTLSPEHAPAPIATTVGRLRVIARGHVPGRLYDVGEYPGAIVDYSVTSLIAGIVYEIPDGSDLLLGLDRYEGFDARHPDASLFLRRTNRITLEDGRTVAAWVYEYQGPAHAGSLIPSGKYRG